MNLFIDSSNNYLIFVLFNDNEIIDRYTELTNRNQSEIFFERLDSFLNKNKLKIKNINNFYFAKGPGSFTGIRVGLTFAKGLVVSHFKNVYVLSSLEILLDETDHNYACIDARNNKYYVLEKKDGILLDEKIIVSENIDGKYHTYENSLEIIPENVFRLVKEKRYSQDLNPRYLKDAF